MPRQSPINDSLLSQRVYDEIYRAMVSKRLEPGDRINRRQVAEDLGVSVAPVLEAMTQLEWEGFLTTTPRRGTMVREVTATQVLGRFHLRIAIETQAARIYAGERIHRAAERARDLAAALDAVPRSTVQAIEKELEFHRALVDAAGCPVLSDVFAHVMRHSLYHAVNQKLPQHPPRPEKMHSRLVNKLLRAGPDEADRLIRLHLDPWIEMLTEAAAAEQIDGQTPDARGKVTRLKMRKRLREKVGANAREKP